MGNEQAMELLENIRFRAERGINPILITAYDIEALNIAISAIKTVDDMPELMTELLRKEKSL
jgi:hypothetical protein